MISDYLDHFAPRLSGIRLHPIKSLDPVSVSEARIGPGGGLGRKLASAARLRENSFPAPTATPREQSRALRNGDYFPVSGMRILSLIIHKCTDRRYSYLREVQCA